MNNRVYDYAKRFAQDTTTFIKNLTNIGIKNKTALNKLDEKEIELIEEKMPKILEEQNQKDEKTIVVQEKKIFVSQKKKEFNREQRNNQKPTREFHKWNTYKERNPKEDGEKKEYRTNKGNIFNKPKFDNTNKTKREFNKDKDNNGKFNNTKFNQKQNDKIKNEVEVPEMETMTKNSKSSKQKTKFDKKKYEYEKKAKEEERKLKELRTDFRKDNAKKKIKKKEKQIKSEVVKLDDTSGVLKIIGELTVKDLADKLGITASAVISKFFMQGKVLTANAILSMEEIEEVALEYNVLIEIEEEVELPYGEKYDLEIEDNANELVQRAPVITIMGHVDHGKTSLLDALRHTNVIANEAGGITQSIGAYQVTWKDQKITFIDTPGHEAFTEMRARGANITDISILIVAADDGVKPQTIEAISHAKEANVPIIVAINKIDKPDANPMRVKQELMEYGLVAQEWGGDTECVEISAKQKINLEELLETIVITSELLELKANPKKRAKAVVVESKLDPQVGIIADMLVQEGTLKIGDIFVVGGTYGRIRSMIDDKGNKITKAEPSMPVEITGFNDIPEAGATLYCVKNDKQARKIVDDYNASKKLTDLNAKKHISLESLSQQLEDEQLKELKCIIRADSKGSVEALKESLNKLSNEKVHVDIIQATAGAITEGDIKLAEASNAIIIGFGVRPTNTARTEAEKTGVEIRNYNVIYHVTEDIEKAMKGMLDPEYREVYHGRLEVLKVFKISNVGNIAGTLVLEGKVTNHSKIRVLRNGIIIFDGNILSLKRHKDEAREVNMGQECGISLKDFNDIKEGDILEAYIKEVIER